MERNQLLGEIRETVSRNVGRNTTTTIAWLSKDQWTITPDERLQTSRIARGLPAKIEPCLVIEVETYDSGPVVISWSFRDHRLNVINKPLPQTARVESLFCEEAIAVDSRGSLTRDSRHALNDLLSSVTTDSEGLTAEQVKDFLDGSPLPE